MVWSHSQPVTLIINDRVEVALEIGADGIHLGQNDADYRRVIKAVSPDMIVKASVQNAGEAIKAEQAGVSYVAVGAVFPTASKTDAQLIGLDGVAHIFRATTIPVVTIGGISYDNIDLVVKAGAHYCALILGINVSADMAARMRGLNRRISEAMVPEKEKP